MGSVTNSNYYIYKVSLRHASTKPKTDKVVVPQTSRKDAGEITVATKVKQAGKDATYTGIVLVGLGVTGLMFYAIGRELFSSQSPSGVYGNAFKECINNTEVSDSLGTPIKGYGETTRRGRRRHVSHHEFITDDGRKHMRMKFYIEGQFRKGTVHLEVVKSDSGAYEYRYLFVELDGYPQRSIILYDNR